MSDNNYDILRGDYFLEGGDEKEDTVERNKKPKSSQNNEWLYAFFQYVSAFIEFTYEFFLTK